MKKLLIWGTFLSIGMSLEAMSRTKVDAATQLRQAVQADDLDEVIQLLADVKVNLLDCDERGNTILHTTARAGQSEMLALLLAHAERHKMTTYVKLAPHEPEEPTLSYGYIGKNLSHKELSAMTGNLLSWDDLVPLFRESDAMKKPHDQVDSYTAISCRNIRNKNNETALQQAIREERLNCVRVLLKPALKDKIEKVKQLLGGKLRKAVQEGKQTEVTQLLSHPLIDLSKTDEHGDTALHRAAFVGNCAILALLLDHIERHKIVARVALTLVSSEELARRYAFKIEGFLPENIAPYLQDAAIRDSGIVEKLILLGLEPDSEKQNRAQAASQVTFPFIDSQNKDIETALHHAVRAGHLDCVRLLLERGADKEICSAKHGRPLHIAAREGHRDIAKLLLERGADCKALDGSKRSPLHAAAMGGCQEIVQELLDRGVVPVFTDADGKTAAQYAHEYKQYAVAAFFLTYAGGVNNFNEQGLRPMHFAAMANDCALANRLEKAGALLNPTDERGLTPTHYAAQHGACQMLSWCLDRAPYLPTGTSLQVMTSLFGDAAESILCVAARAKQREAMKLIIDRRKEIQPKPIDILYDTVTTKDGREISHMQWALEEQLPDFIELLCKNGVAETPEIKLAERLWINLQKEEAKLGEYPGVESISDEATPLHLAAEEGHRELCNTIIESMISHELGLLAHRLVRESERNFNALVADRCLRDKREVHERHVQTIMRRNEEAKRRGFEEDAIPPADPLGWLLQFDKHVGAGQDTVAEKAQRVQRYRDAINKFNHGGASDDMVWTVLSASCWPMVKDLGEAEIDSSKIIKTSINDRIKPLFSPQNVGDQRAASSQARVQGQPASAPRQEEELSLLSQNRVRDVLKKMIASKIAQALQKKRRVGSLRLTPGACALLKNAVTDRDIAEERKKAQEAVANAQAEGQKAQSEGALASVALNNGDYDKEKEHNAKKNEHKKLKKEFEQAEKAADEQIAKCEELKQDREALKALLEAIPCMPLRKRETLRALLEAIPEIALKEDRRALRALLNAIPDAALNEDCKALKVLRKAISDTALERVSEAFKAFLEGAPDKRIEALVDKLFEEDWSASSNRSIWNLFKW